MGLADFFKSNSLEVIDKRANGGCLWVVGSQDQLGPYVAKAKELYGEPVALRRGEPLSRGWDGI